VRAARAAAAAAHPPPPPPPLTRSPTRLHRRSHLRDLLQDDSRAEAFAREHAGLYLDLSRQRATPETLRLLLALAEAAGLPRKIAAMAAGERINGTEGRAVLHMALRAPRAAHVVDAGTSEDVVPGVWAVLDKIAAFSESVRLGARLGATGKPLTDVVAIGIGGSALGPAFVHTALATDAGAGAAAAGRRLRFLANVDPVDAAATLADLNPETTLAIVVSKTFTTAETMRNARTVRAWLTRFLGEGAVAAHMVAVSTNLPAVAAFGLDPADAFGFWDWVGGRYSASSAVGVLPLSLQYGFPVVRAFLDGMADVDAHFVSAPLAENLPALMGLFNVWNASFLGYAACAVLPYQQALSGLAPHVQQLSMESNGKGVAADGAPLPFAAGELDFGEPGTNGQHSFYQLLHQGRVVPAEFIGAAASQQEVFLAGEPVSSHAELMCNFFAQPDALATGKSAAELRAEGVPEALIPHKTFTGNRPSLSLLLPELTPFALGQLLALYEARVATSGFVWGINSFDQWGVQLGKVLADAVRGAVVKARAEGRPLGTADGFNGATTRLLNRFLAAPAAAAPPAGGADVWPPALRTDA
jgi:glucose-6-phosphate isomerase